jgi:hypothetical protein
MERSVSNTFYPNEASMVSPQATGSQTIHPQTIGSHTFHSNFPLPKPEFAGHCSQPN